MPVEFLYHEEGGFLEVILLGAFALEDVIDALGVMVNSNEWPPNVDVLWDGRMASVDHIDRAFLEDLAIFRSNIDLLRRQSRAAVVFSAKAERVSAQLPKLFAEKYLSSEVRVFHDRDEAIRWLRGGKTSSRRSIEGR